MSRISVAARLMLRDVRNVAFAVACVLILMPAVGRAKQHLIATDTVPSSARFSTMGDTPPTKANDSAQVTLDDIALLPPSAHLAVVVPLLRRRAIVEPSLPDRPFDNSPDLVRGPPSSAPLS